MADEIKKVITIDTGESITSLKEYKKHIDELRGALLALDEDSEEYATIVDEIREEQAKLNEVMKAGKETTDAADGSYDQLVQTMKELKKQWRATGDETERTEIGEKILDINNRLKDLDASTGNFQRNVGNYEGAFSKAMEGLKGGMASSIPVIGKVNAAMKMLAANPIGLVITALVSAFMLLKNAISGSESQSMRLKEAFAILRPIIDGIKNAVSAVADAFVTLMEKASNAVLKIMKELKTLWEYLGWDEWAESIGNTINAMEEQKALVAEENELIIRRRELLKKEAETRARVSELELKAASKEQYTAEQRKQFIEEAIALEQDLAEEKYKLAVDEADALEREARRTQNDAEMNEKLAQAEAKRNNALADRNNQLRSLQRRLESVNSEIEGIAAAADKANAAAIAATQAQKDAADAILNNIREAAMTQLEQLDKTYREQKETLLKAYAEDSAEMLELTQHYEEERAKIIREQEEAIAKQFIETETARNEAMMKSYEESAAQALFESENAILEETEVEQAQRIAQAKYDIDKQLIEQKIQLQQSYLEALEANGIKSIEAEQQLAAYRQDLSNLDMARAKAVADYEKEQAKQVMEYKKAAWNASLTSAASIFGSLADLMDQGSEEAKALSIMETTINTIAGAIGAFMQASSSYPAPYGQIIGGATAAAVTAAGIAEINKIRQTTKSSANSASVSAPSVSTPDVGAIVSPLLNEDQDIQGMITLPETPRSQQQGDTRVYVVESDIAEAGKKVEVREHEATF